ncbi:MULTISPECIES: 23S rRNA (uracil(1939)-C(5))-methyltransferase RlmD [Cetobacterium]|uniref:23S rRNA (Uracil(1939)-C(5))-methyltransferase RlmD n=1 Tax=Candidatus Cetobacterium colombiensis TaxID=3073100 RepID=A0ABU4W7K8_9FUSO|nr:23S rRNA (uracil(1939)-C(5))-methyltransferase RlmD [Candidatus Cetobacterium colombiensis]MDX8335508.1 23S rRNA (uracil(1939)-C(5))-methyltransferase RlmD [Candidatus Cetobacterium colombiensis]
MKLQKGQIIELKIEKIVYGGEGLGYYNNEFAMFVPMSVPGDILKVEIISLKKTYGRALIKSIISPGEERISDLNRLTFEDFQGCDFGMLNYESQLKYKRDMVEDVVRRIGKNSIVNIEETLGSPVESNYRNKVIEPFSLNGNEIITGFFKRKSHDVFQVEDNMLNSILGNKIISKLKDILNKKKISVYDEKRHKGLLRHVMVRTNSFNEAMLVLIINDTKISENIKEILKEVMDNFKEVVSVYVSLNDRKTNVALGNKNILICGEKTIKEDISGIHFNISPTSFFQINLEQTRRLYELAISMFENIENKNIVDAYAGTGTIGMILSKKAKKVYSIEIVESAVKDGIKTAKENKIENVEFICGDVNQELGKLIKAEAIDSIILDPPRKGIDEESLLNISKVGIKEIVYISCNPSTFARDIEILEKEGYELVKVKPVDMFPQTSHIEVVGRLIKK